MVAGIKLNRKKTYTIEEFIALPEDGNHYELVEGKLEILVTAGEEHGRIAGTLHVYLGAYILQNKLGRIYSAETGLLRT